MIITIGVAFGLLGITGWIIYEAFMKPPPPKICGSPNGPPLTAPRVKLNDGRHLAYKELGVSKEEAQHKIIVCHGLYSNREMDLPISQETLKELKVYLLVYDRAGHGESDPHPSRSVKTEAFDIQELADKLELGPKFYILGCSVGAYPVWACLKYIPHRLQGACLVVPMVNLWWPSLPSALSQSSYRKYPQAYRSTFWIAYHTPWFMYLWMTNKLFPKMTHQGMLSDSDVLTLNQSIKRTKKRNISDQGEHECIHRDLLCYFGKWEFDPVEMTNPFPENKANVHMWLGTEDRLAPVELNRFIAQKLPWIQSHEFPNTGHYLIHDSENLEAMIRSLLV